MERKTHSVNFQFPYNIFENFVSGQQWTTIIGKLFYVFASLKVMLAKEFD